MSTNEPPTASALLAERLAERLRALPLRLVNGADYDLAREAFERMANYYFDTYVDKPSERPLRYMLIVENHVYFAREMDLEEVRQIYGRDVIPLRACLNTLRALANVMLDRGGWFGRESFTDDELTRRAYGLVALAEGESRRPFEGNDVY